VSRPFVARAAVVLAALAALAAAPAPEVPQVEPAKDVVRFGVLGDSGSGDPAQYRVGDELAAAHRYWYLDFVIMLGDNIYGRDNPAEYARKFERPYRALLDAGVPFYAALGNHDDPNQRFYRPFNMDGKRYYTFKRGSVRLYALDSNYMQPEQVAWLKKEACGANDRWKIAFFHHPIYSSARTHGSSRELRRILEPVFQECGIDVVFAGHDHTYERIKPQNGILYFVSGGAGKLRRGDLRRGALTAAGFDEGFHFMVVAIEKDKMRFSTITDKGRVVDEGEWAGRESTAEARR
jgi:predicted phosphodiesterase